MPCLSTEEDITSYAPASASLSMGHSARVPHTLQPGYVILHILM